MSLKLARIVDTVDEKLREAEAGPPTPPPGKYWEWTGRRRIKTEGLLAELAYEVGLKIYHRAPDVHTVSIARIRATSTAGWVQALRNWQRLARLRLRAEA